jgi:hypothetical protein
MNATQPPSSPAPPPYTGQLTSEDYENIWLRMKERFWKHMLAAVTVAIALGGVGGFELAKIRLTEAVSSFTRTDDFIKNLRPLVVEHLPELDKHIGELEQREKTLSDALTQRREELVRLSNSGLTIGPRQLALTSNDGRIFRIEAGVLQQSFNGDVKFGIPFSSKPLVFLTPTGTLSRLAPTIEQADERGFSVSGPEHYSTVQWVAIGD